MRSKSKLITLMIAWGLIWASSANAQSPPVPPAQFDMTGFIQAATVGTVGSKPPASPLLRGGTITVNGIKCIVPNNTIVQMPASSFTWAQLFDPANSASIPPGRPNHPADQTGLALQDSPAGAPVGTGGVAFPAFEVRVVGNIMVDPVSGTPHYIVGLIVPITQQSLNVGSGIINSIDYAHGMIRVGGIVGNASTGTLVQINDPVGRFGRTHSPDPRFSSDTNNPTISTTTGYPVCIPRYDPTTKIDPKCPMTNRPLNGDPLFPKDPYLAVGAPLRTFNMPAPGTLGYKTDPTKQVPLMVGDWVDFSGTIFKRNPAGLNTPGNMFVSAHTLTANLGIYTAPGVQPAYINSSVLIGTNGGAAVTGYGTPPTDIPQEPATRITIEGFTTDPTALVDIFAIDVHPVSGAETLRLLGTTFPEDGVTKLRPRGRYRFIIGKGAFTPVTREYVAISRTGVTPNVANGLTAGQYRLPCFDYIFPEGTTFGTPIVSNNFNDIPFLAQGSGPLGGFGSGGPVIGPLNPWPGPLRTAAAAPAAQAGTDIPQVTSDIPAAEGDILPKGLRGRIRR